ncbi:MAG: restriction endonuclease [Alphaproteobacteria bacterium]|jgi:restriction system protein|nr:restriction endonuclease [Alphaproteobacteria bacterium]
MAVISMNRTSELVHKLFFILIQEPEGLKARVALERLASSVTLTEHEAGMYQSGTRRFEKIVRFATIDCVKAGWLIKQRGMWLVSDDGARAFKEYKDPETFYRQACRLCREWKAQQEGSQPDLSCLNEPIEVEAAEESRSITFEQADEQAWTEVERFLKGMNPYEFQEVVADLLRAMGQYVAWVSPPGKDGGIDILAYPDPLGTKSPRLKVQVKRRSDQRVDLDGVKSFAATINHDDAGVFVCTSGFTKDAEEFVRREQRRIMLIDLDRFFELWTQFYDKLDDQARRRFPLTPIYFLTPEG